MEEKGYFACSVQSLLDTIRLNKVNYAIRKYKLCKTKRFMNFMILKLGFSKNTKPNNIKVVEMNHKLNNKDKEHFKKEITACITSKMTREVVAPIWFYLNSIKSLKIKQEHIDLIKTRSWKNNDRM